MPNKKMLISAAEKFIKKVDSGKAHSIDTYKELKEALSADDNRIEENIKKEEYKIVQMGKYIYILYKISFKKEKEIKLPSKSFFKKTETKTITEECYEWWPYFGYNSDNQLKEKYDSYTAAKNDLLENIKNSKIYFEIESFDKDGNTVKTN